MSHMTNEQYSYCAQLVCQPLSSYALIVFPVKYWVMFNMTACKSHSELTDMQLKPCCREYRYHGYSCRKELYWPSFGSYVFGCL